MPDILCGFGLEFSLTGFQLLFAVIASCMWISVLLFSSESMRNSKHMYRYYIFMFLTYIATMGVFLSANFITTFIFFELMSFTSYVLVIHEETPQAMRAGQIYLAVAVIGGMVMLMGLFMLYDIFGTLRFQDLYRLSASSLDQTGLYVAGALVFTGFGIKAGIIPLHIWLPDTYTMAPAPVTTLLSGILSKTGIFGIILLTCRIFYEDAPWGNALLVLGVITMFGGAVFALLSVDLKRTLAYSSISQIGFITVGIGMICLSGDVSAMAARGTILYMVNHSLIKWVMFLAAGVIYIKIKKMNLNDIKGYGRKKPLLALLFLSGALSISGLPFTSGYVSKTLLHETIVEYIEHGLHLGQDMMAFQAVEWMFLLSGAITLAYMSKLFVCIFIEKNANPTVQKQYEQQNGHYMNLRCFAAIVLPAGLLVFMGLTPQLSMDAIANYAQDFFGHYEVEASFHYYTLANLSGPLISMLLGGGIYAFVVRLMFEKGSSKENKTYVSLWPENWNLERMFYRPLLRFLLWLLKKSFTFLGSIEIHNRYIKQIEPHEERFTPMDWIKNHPLSDKWRSAREAVLEVSESMSFGLLAAVIGLCTVLIYLL